MNETFTIRTPMSPKLDSGTLRNFFPREKRAKFAGKEYIELYDQYEGSVVRLSRLTQLEIYSPFEDEWVSISTYATNEEIHEMLKNIKKEKTEEPAPEINQEPALSEVDDDQVIDERVDETIESESEGDTQPEAENYVALHLTENIHVDDSINIQNTVEDANVEPISTDTRPNQPINNTYKVNNYRGNKNGKR